MSRELDRRNFNRDRGTAERQSRLQIEAENISDGLPGNHRVRIDQFRPISGNPTRVISRAAPVESGNYLNRAKDHINSIRGVLGLVASQPVDFIADEDYQITSDGSVAVHFRQFYQSLEIFESAQVVRFGSDGAIIDSIGDSANVDQDVSASPQLSIEEAVKKAAIHVCAPDDDEHQFDHFGEPLNHSIIDLQGVKFKIRKVLSKGPDRATYFEPGPFEDKIKASLIWFPLDGALRLAWEVLLSMPASEGQYRVLIDAVDGSVLYCSQLMKWIAGRGNVYLADGSQARNMIDFPRDLADYGLPIPGDLPPTVPVDWVAASRSEGNNVFARLGANGASIEGESQSGFVSFNPVDPVGDDQKVLNIFYYNAYMHDFFYLLGFRERDGNFQENNFLHGGLASDRVDARAHSGAVFGTANMATPIDGNNPVMNMGLVTSTNRHTAFDSSVVFHEFMHGVTNRLVGGPANSRALEQPQSGGMGEGWGDYVACTINQNDTVGSWVVNSSNGIRGFRYDNNFPDHFGNLGTGRYSQVHNIGEIWCATLLNMNRRIGSMLGIQLVVDALKLSPASPGFLDMRDAILVALNSRLAANLMTVAEHRLALSGIWAAFARFGMGPNARSNGASLSGIVADFNVPPEPDPVPDPIPDPVPDPIPDPVPDPVPDPPPAGPIIVRPDLPIPDANPGGISSALTFARDGIVSSVKVKLDIQHTYIGDLRVSLASPGGDIVLLHSQTGGSSDNLIRTYTIADTPQLSVLTGQAAKGIWTLNVADLAGQDLGRLREWSLDIKTEVKDDVVRGRAFPNLSIPDFSESGIRSSIAIARDGTLHKISVDLTISHTYIGDLRVSLIAPNGGVALLHDQSGGSVDNLVRTYSSDDIGSLLALRGSAIRGAWVLHVVDLARRDLGTLEQWGIEIEPAAAPRVVVEKISPNLPVPDNDPAGISSNILVGGAGIIASVAIDVEILHTYIGDLRVTLSAADGAVIVLHNGSGGSADNLIKRYTNADSAALATLIGKQGQGLWTLKVSDLAGQDRGTLQSWGLEFHYA